MPAAPKKSPSTAPPPARAFYTHAVLWQLAATALGLGGVLIWQWDLAWQIYVQNQLNALGWAVNGGIGMLFVGGLLVLLRRFLAYRVEESTLARLREIYAKADAVQDAEILAEIPAHSFIGQRYRTLQDLRSRGAVVDHSALAASLQAREASRNSFPKFVQNVLILTGVFGTIVSLSLSLLGAAEMLHSETGSGGGLGTMIFGMSTALSTTMTAILAYVIFGYFYIKLTDTQTYLLSEVEAITTTLLLPQMQARIAEDPAAGLEGIAAMTALLKAVLQEQRHSVTAQQRFTELLQAGFRLPRK